MNSVPAARAKPLANAARVTPRAFALVGFVALAALAWAFLWQSSAAMATMSGGWLHDLMLAMMRPNAVGAYLAAAILMWVIMMIAMMTPAVLPVVVLFWRVKRAGRSDATRVRDGALFGAAYVLVWCGFGIVLASMQWGLHRGAMLHHHLLDVGPVFGAGLAIAAGIYQLTPFKTACLRHCQSPLGFLMSHWQPGGSGAIRMGMAHGAYCLGCCWALMVLMFVGGVMSIGAMVAISVVILLERLLPPRPWVSRLPGMVLIAWGVWLLVQQF